jgi:PhnB protein
MLNLPFEFIVDKENNTINVTRGFNANLALVWEAWTNPEILDQWWAPKPYKTETKSMNFSEGGRWLYSMVGPTGDRHWCLNEYQKIKLHEMFAGLDAFCDENGVINDEFPRTNWENTFSENNGTTSVNIVATYASLEDLEKIISLGFKEGFTMALENLDQYLEAQFKLRNENKTTNQPRVTTYLNFDGKTEEAMLFYRDAFQTEFINGMQRFGDLPENPEHPIADNIKRMILHVELPILGGHILMATDAPKEMGFTLTPGNNMHISLEPSSREEADRLFQALSINGKIEMPMQEMFFGSYYGAFSDQYGINWMINFKL